MVSVKDIQIKKPTEQQIQICKSWPVWQSQPRSFDWVYTQTETCLVIEGKVTISDNHSSVTIGPGDLAVLPEDLECTWHITEPLKKHYTFE